MNPLKPLLCLLTLLAMASPTWSEEKMTPTPAHPLTLAGPNIGVAWGFLYGYEGSPAPEYMPCLRRMGTGFSKVYLFWSQIEPEPDRYDWTAVDKYVNQLKSPDEGLIALFSASNWATKEKAPMLPPSPAKNPDEYYRFVHALVTHCKGRVRYWQNDCEPNNPIYWAGTDDEFVAQLKVFYRAVKDADPHAVVIAGGYDGLFNPPGAPFEFPGQAKSLAFFDKVLDHDRDSFDLFDLRLYADPYSIVDRVEFMRARMKALGYEKPIVCTEYNGPGFFEFVENLQYIQMVTQLSNAITNPPAGTDPAAPTPERKGIADLYARMSTLPPQTQMFMEGCPPEVDAKLRRIQARDIVMRNLFALSAGVQKTLFWDLWHDISDRDGLMQLMFGKLRMTQDKSGDLSHAYPMAGALERTAAALRGATSVQRLEFPTNPRIYLFAIQRQGRRPGYVVWERRDTFSGEDQPATPFDWPWPTRKATAVDALGVTLPTVVNDGKLHLKISLTPIFLEQN